MKVLNELYTVSNNDCPVSFTDAGMLHVGETALPQ